MQYSEFSEVKQTVLHLGKRALSASRALAGVSAEQKNAALEAIALELEARQSQVQKHNFAEVEAARSAGLSEAMCDRLLLHDNRYRAMVKGVRDICLLPDPVGEELKVTLRPNGLKIRKVRVPLGVIAIIYESRPNVTVDAASLCLKTSNAVILRGGSEALSGNQALVEALQAGICRVGLPPDAVLLVPTKDREAVRELVQLEGYVSVVIPRGGEGLIRAVTDMAKVPVLKHYKGVCHVYVDNTADEDMALNITENAKCQRPAVCNAMETLLVHEGIAASFLPKAAAMLQKRGVEIRGDEKTCSYISGAKPASEQDWSKEYLDLVLSVKIVPDVKAAVEHINTYGSQHTDAIITRDKNSEQYFVENVDSGVVCVNASTRFNDGGEFGMGAEMGISTDKLHARGPVGLEELTSYKYIVLGEGQVRE